MFGWLRSTATKSNAPAVTQSNEDEKLLPITLRVAGATGWKIVGVAGGLVVVGLLLWQIQVILVPMLVAFLITVLLEPISNFVQKSRFFGRTMGATVALLAGIGLVSGLLALASAQIVANFNDLATKAGEGFNTLVKWLSEGPLKLDESQITSYTNKITEEATSLLQSNYSQVATGALSVTSSMGSLLTGLAMMLFAVFFFLKDGRAIWQFFLRMTPQKVRSPLNEAAIRGWVTLSLYAKAQVQVAAIDAIGIGLGAWILGVPLALPIGVMVFLGAFIPIVGAIATGAIAVLIALVDSGVVTALLMVVVILVVQQLESNVFYPLLMSQSINLHPLAVLLAVAIGGFAFGIAGAMFAVPIMAFINTVVMYLYGYDQFRYLRHDPNRPGGPPGSLQTEISLSLAPTVSNLEGEEAAKKRLERLEKGMDVKLSRAQRKAEEKVNKATAEKRLEAIEKQIKAADHTSAAVAAQTADKVPESLKAQEA